MIRILKKMANLKALGSYLFYVCDEYVKHYKNFNYDFDYNGEHEVIRFLSRNEKLKTVFDVGAHAGEWSQMAREYFPDAAIHSFEPVHYLFEKAVSRLQGSSVVLNNKALGSREEKKDIHAGANNSFQSSFVVEPYVRDWKMFSPETVQVTTGDRYTETNAISFIDFLKIDVEGYESEVLKGFERMLSEGNIRVIQFEYGTASIFANFLLKDFYKYLGQFNYKIGKLMPDGIFFKPYHSRDEDFLGPNYIAVREHDSVFDKFISKRVINIY